MKKLLGIVVLGLLLCGNAYAEEKKLLGIVSIGDVVNHIIEQYKDENQQLRSYINQ